MDDSLKKFFYIFGIIAAIYLLFRYIIPILFKVLGWIVGTLFTILLWVLVAVMIVAAVGYIIQLFKK